MAALENSFFNFIMPSFNQFGNFLSGPLYVF